MKACRQSRQEADLPHESSAFAEQTLLGEKSWAVQVDTGGIERLYWERRSKKRMNIGIVLVIRACTVQLECNYRPVGIYLVRSILKTSSKCIRNIPTLQISQCRELVLCSFISFTVSIRTLAISFLEGSRYEREISLFHPGIQTLSWVLTLQYISET